MQMEKGERQQPLAVLFSKHFKHLMTGAGWNAATAAWLQQAIKKGEKTALDAIFFYLCLFKFVTHSILSSSFAENCLQYVANHWSVTLVQLVISTVGRNRIICSPTPLLTLLFLGGFLYYFCQFFFCSIFFLLYFENNITL